MPVQSTDTGGNRNDDFDVSYVSFGYADLSNYYREPSHSVVNASERRINMLAPLGPLGNPGAPRTYGTTRGHHF